MKAIFVVVVRWVSSPINPALVDAVMSEAGDWVRVTGDTWIVVTDLGPTFIRDLLLKHLSTEDQSMILPINPYAPADGWMPPWVWQWLRDQTAVLHLPARTPEPTRAPLPSIPPPGNRLPR